MLLEFKDNCLIVKADGETFPTETAFYQALEEQLQDEGYDVTLSHAGADGHLMNGRQQIIRTCTPSPHNFGLRDLQWYRIETHKRLRQEGQIDLAVYQAWEEQNAHT